MATSGSYDYSVTAAQIITAALEDIGAIAAGETVPAADSATALVRLNFIAKQFQGGSDGAPGMKVHTRQRIHLFLAKGQQTYTIGPAATDARATTLYGRTTLSGAEAAAQTTISITSNTDTTTFPGSTVTMTAADFIGVQLNDGTIHWTTISGTPASTADLTAGLPSAANAGNYVWWFTSRAQRFPLLEAACLRDRNLNDTPLNVFDSIKQYELGIVSKYADGTPTSILSEPLRLNTRITLDSQPTNVADTIVLTALYPAEDYDSTSNEIAFPQEWFAALEWELAFRLAPAFEKTWTPDMDANHKNALALARNINPENSVLYFQPNA